MIDQLLKVSLKFGFILCGIYLLFGLINTLTFNPDNNSEWIYGLTAIFTWLSLSILIPMAHYEFNRKNENFISFKDAILIGLIILAISWFISGIYSYTSYEVLLKEKIQLYYSNMRNEYGIDLNESLFSTDVSFFSFDVLLEQILLLFVIITMESQWKIYKKAGKEGWASIVPVYNMIVLLEIVKKPAWWLIFLIIPFVNLFFAIWITNLLSKRFGKDEGFTVGLIFLPFIFFPLLGMSKIEYIDE